MHSRNNLKYGDCVQSPIQFFLLNYILYKKSKINLILIYKKYGKK